MKRWVVVFQALANVNRIETIRLLSGGRKMAVGDIADALDISFTATSNHLIMLQKLGVLDAEGRRGHVYYRINPNMPSDFSRAVALFLRRS